MVFLNDIHKLLRGELRLGESLAGRATSLDALMLIKKVQDAVQRKFKITLELDVKLLEFDRMTLREVA